MVPLASRDDSDIIIIIIIMTVIPPNRDYDYSDDDMVLHYHANETVNEQLRLYPCRIGI